MSRRNADARCNTVRWSGFCLHLSLGTFTTCTAPTGTQHMTAELIKSLSSDSCLHTAIPIMAIRSASFPTVYKFIPQNARCIAMFRQPVYHQCLTEQQNWSVPAVPSTGLLQLAVLCSGHSHDSQGHCIELWLNVEIKQVRVVTSLL